MKCPACKTEQADTNNFCSECGHKLETSTESTKPSDKGARKHTTILFSDLSGYTSMSEKLDPEEVKEISYKINNLYSKDPIQYPGCFLSYSSKNKKFVEKLYNDLQSNGVRCWCADEDI